MKNPQEVIRENWVDAIKKLILLRRRAAIKVVLNQEDEDKAMQVVSEITRNGYWWEKSIFERGRPR